MSKQHPEKWAIYKALETEEDQEAFFKEHGKVYRYTLRSHFVSESAGERAIVFDIDKDIVEVIVGDMFSSRMTTLVSKVATKRSS